MLEVSRDQDDEEFFVVDEDRGAVVAGPFDDKDAAADDARDRSPSHIVATRGVLKMMEMTSRARIRWENDDVDVVTDGGVSRCAECGAVLPEEIDPGTGVYCTECGHGQLVTDGGRDVQALYKRATNTWGPRAQVDKAIEECSELSAELARTQNGLGDDAELAEEIADAEIMLEQLRHIVDSERVDAARDVKLERLEERLDEADGIAADGGDVVPMIKRESPWGTTIVGPEPAAYLAWEAEREGGEGDV